MPYVNVRITKEGNTPEQKAQVIAEITETLERVLGKAPELTHIVIDEIPMEDWGYKGLPTSQLRKPNPG
ncbi:MAG TPA: 4-oxalocrotonate tautomerase family protein [Luteibacter sp.]|jgi:4-oxalocrotonate tautomerase|nr:4-oxalocrotonate tautomerase family protein [Luteibacter sp.]